MTDTDQKKRQQATKALNFLQRHPALNTPAFADSTFPGNWFHMAECCKRGMSKDAIRMTTVNRGEKGWEKFKDKFEKEYKDDKDEPKRLQYIYLTYKEKYGEPWVFDHVEYWYETTFFVFNGDPYDRMAGYDYKNWGRFGGPSGGANTFEDALIRQAREVKKIYGNFNEDSFYLDSEIKNHKEERLFHKFDELIEGKYVNFDKNPKYIEVTDAMVNLRWLKWFKETDYCKKNWDFHDDEFSALVKSLDSKMPKEYKRNYKRYKDKG